MADGWVNKICVCVCCSDQADVMLLLLQYGAQVNAVNSSQCSALHIAVNKQHVRCVQALLRHGCDVNVQVNLSSYMYRGVVKLSHGRGAADIVACCTLVDGHRTICFYCVFFRKLYSSSLLTCFVLMLYCSVSLFSVIH